MMLLQLESPDFLLLRYIALALGAFLAFDARRFLRIVTCGNLPIANWVVVVYRILGIIILIGAIRFFF